ncbi:hypothetical protein [Enterovirga aerilata]|uniref:Uncharacterized protein n=1 Tax=Enterovirga aerilata TaxID=2730920 RepID=A0A849IBZ0_9HYPH|nr:hypothetical protein [Enterovirga sp. DB1703]NNM74791.1 hypothetical protein [Enterovirga sp. DB1703]
MPHLSKFTCKCGASAKIVQTYRGDDHLSRRYECPNGHRFSTVEIEGTARDVIGPGKGLASIEDEIVRLGERIRYWRAKTRDPEGTRLSRKRAYYRRSARIEARRHGLTMEEVLRSWGVAEFCGVPPAQPVQEAA